MFAIVLADDLSAAPRRYPKLAVVVSGNENLTRGQRAPDEVVPAVLGKARGRGDVSPGS